MMIYLPSNYQKQNSSENYVSMPQVMPPQKYAYVQSHPQPFEVTGPMMYMHADAEFMVGSKIQLLS